MTEENTEKSKQKNKRKKRLRGTGSIYRRSDGRYAGEITLEDGKRKQVYGKSETEVQKKIDQIVYEQKQGLLATGPRQTLKDYIERWLEEVHKPVVRLSTYARHRHTVYKHIIPVLGHIELKKITPEHVQKFYNEKGREGLASSSIRNIHSVLSNAFKNAVRWKLIPQNVCSLVTLPPLKKRKNQTLTKEQIIKLLDVAKEHNMGPFIRLALMSGMRHGEMLALQWSDIDFESGILSIQHNVYRVSGYGYLEGDPKTESSKRQIILPKFVATSLMLHRERQQEIRKAAGSKWKEKDLVFCTRNGTFISQDRNLGRFRKVLEEAGLPTTMRIHDLRHNVATFLIKVMKYPPNFVQELLGHSDLATTLGIYTHTDPEDLRKMMEGLNDLFGG